MPHVRTTIITEASGFIGTELVKLLVARGHQVVGLAESVGAATHLRRAGAVAVMGTLLEASMAGRSSGRLGLPPEMSRSGYLFDRDVALSAGTTSATILLGYLTTFASVFRVPLTRRFEWDNQTFLGTRPRRCTVRCAD